MTPIPVHIHLIPLNATLVLSESSPNASQYITMSVKVSEDDEVRTPEKRRLNDCKWSLELFDKAELSERVKETGGIGVLSHHEAASDVDYDFPESCAMWASVRHETFASLLNIVTSGRLPSSIRVQVLGPSYGWEPDGSAKEWNLESAAILDMDIYLPLVLQLPSEPEMNSADAIETNGPIGRMELQKVANSIISTSVGSASLITKYLSWLLILLALLILTVWFK